MQNPTIISGKFAEVTSGNCTHAFIVDGDDAQARADAAMDSYWGGSSTIIRRNIDGHAISIGQEYMLDLYTSLEAAQIALAKLNKLREA